MVWYRALVPIVKKSLNTPVSCCVTIDLQQLIVLLQTRPTHRFFLTLHYQKTQESQNYSHRFTCNPLAIWTGSKRTITKAQLATRDFNSRYSKTHDYNIGYKLFSIAYPPSNCYASSSILVSPPEPPLVDIIVHELKKKTNRKEWRSDCLWKGILFLQKLFSWHPWAWICPTYFLPIVKKFLQYLLYPFSIF